MKREETFFRPSEMERRAWALPGHLYNRGQTLCKRVPGEHLFVPLRDMFYLAVVSRDEVVFVNAEGGYRFGDSGGGRVIEFAWCRFRPQGRNALADPVPCDLVFFTPGAQLACERALGLYGASLAEVSARLDREQSSRQGADVVSLRGWGRQS